MSFRESNVNLGVGHRSEQPPHLVGEACSGHSGFSRTAAKRTPSPTSICAGGEKLRKMGGFAHSGDAGEETARRAR